ncbi:MAG: TetR/AcrR family transcriptional regulator [Proteobacteria bacterium]|nr:MAG: TetR/AcrR family transcriptional regulator [Pseudomonadota bacterium]
MIEKKKRRPHRRRDFVVDKILRHALRELTARGGGGFRVENVAKAAEVNKTTIYRRWPTKDQLIRAALSGGGAGKDQVFAPKEAGSRPEAKREFIALSEQYGAWASSEVGKSFSQLEAGPKLAAALRQMMNEWRRARREPLKSFARTYGVSRGLAQEIFVDAWEGALLRKGPGAQPPKATAALADLLLGGITFRK